MLVAAFGGLEGRALRRGDRLKLGVREEGRELRDPPRGDDGTDALRVVPGPELAGALPLLLASTFTLSAASNRVGARLDGARLPSEEVLRSMPMVAGAIQVPPSGQPIVLGPDHPTTGGYPVIAVLASGELGRLYQRALGAAVRFRT